MSSVICLNLDMSKILSSGNGYDLIMGNSYSEKAPPPPPLKHALFGHARI